MIMECAQSYQLLAYSAIVSNTQCYYELMLLLYIICIGGKEFCIWILKWVKT